MHVQTPVVAKEASQPIETAEDAAKLMAHLCHVMHSLVELLEKETELVRAGRLSEVARLEPSKAELARLYVADAALVKANATMLSRLLPTMFHDLRQRHDTFQALLQINLTVLATAHAVSEGIIRGLAGELTRKAAPKTYGMSGRPSAPGVGAPPITLSRTL